MFQRTTSPAMTSCTPLLRGRGFLGRRVLGFEGLGFRVYGSLFWSFRVSGLAFRVLECGV